jgi:hypothetical protein
MKVLDIINSIEGILKLKEAGAEIYLVGGCVRDHYLGKISKDIDLIVRLLEPDDILSILQKFGNVDLVGESFGVIKFKPFDWIGEPIDIALPRKDKLIDKSLGHRGIKAEFDPFISIEDDLYRRDFKINSIAISLNGDITDPFNGLDDIKNKVISATSEKAFSEDPLRMLRAIQFSSRFNFNISDTTWKMITDNKSDIRLMSGERILEELNKIFYKGNIHYGLELFRNSGLHTELFNNRYINNSLLNNIKTIEDFYYVICMNSDIFKNVLKGENGIVKGIGAIENLMNVSDISKPVLRQKLFDSIKISESVLNSDIIKFLYEDTVKEFSDNKYPKSLKELAISGDDLKEFGYVDIEIGKRFKLLLSEIFSDKRKNTYEDLISE